VCIKIHPFGLTFLLINIRHPNKWRTSSDERCEDLWNQEVRNHAGVERSRAKDNKVGLLNGG
jgi:hypothetical protein